MSEHRKKMTTNSSINSGLRLKKVRLMAGFTQQALGQQYGINLNTLQAWEQAKSPLSYKGAIRILDALHKSGVQCSIEWLLNGKGSAPKFLELADTQDGNTLHKEKKKCLSSNLIRWDDDLAIINEVNFFYSNNHDSLILIVTDDGMSPFYSVGDYVGGKRKCNTNIEKLLGTNCIMETKAGTTLLRRLEYCRKPGLYTLCCTNPITTVQSPILYDVEIISIAPVIWHRKKNFE